MFRIVSETYSEHAVVKEVRDGKVVFGLATLGDLVDCWKRHRPLEDGDGVLIGPLAAALVASPLRPLRVGGIHLDVPAGSKITVELPKD